MYNRIIRRGYDFPHVILWPCIVSESNSKCNICNQEPGRWPCQNDLMLLFAVQSLRTSEHSIAASPFGPYSLSLWGPLLASEVDGKNLSPTTLMQGLYTAQIHQWVVKFAKPTWPNLLKKKNSTKFHFGAGASEGSAMQPANNIQPLLPSCMIDDKWLEWVNECGGHYSQIAEMGQDPQPNGSRFDWGGILRCRRGTVSRNRVNCL